MITQFPQWKQSRNDAVHGPSFHGPCSGSVHAVQPVSSASGAALRAVPSSVPACLAGLPPAPACPGTIRSAPEWAASAR